MRLLIYSILITNILSQQCFAHERWEYWKPANSFQELALMLKDYEDTCTTDYVFNQQGEVIDFNYIKNQECIAKHNQIWKYIYDKFPLIRSGEI